ncbi:MAG: PH domain-containing protein [Verrucomicrobiota bacterium]
MSDSEKAEVYRSKVDWWVGVLLTFSPAIHLPLAIWVMTKGNILFGFILIFWGLIMAGIISMLLFPCHYEIKGPKLTIRSGMVNDPIMLHRIESVEPTKSWVPAPALSLDRLDIRLQDGTKRIISPKDKEGFLAAIGKSESKPV